jgi:hypothetical protein
MLVRFLGVAAVLAVGIWLCTSSGIGAGNANNMAWKPVVDDADALKLAKQSLAIIQQDAATLVKNKNEEGKPLKKPEVRKLRKRIQLNGALLAVYAKSAKAGANHQELISLGEAGLKFSKAAAGDAKPAQLQKMAADLAATKANASAKLEGITWTDYFEDQDAVMTVFKRLPLGGNGLPKSLQSTPRLKTSLNGIEEKVKVLARTKVKDIKKEGPDLATMAEQIAAIAQLNHDVPAIKEDEGKKKVSDWNEWTADMRTIALDLAGAAKKANANDVQKISKKLQANCTKCHDIFKP